jgi:hypothetical protein
MRYDVSNIGFVLETFVNFSIGVFERAFFKKYFTYQLKNCHAQLKHPYAHTEKV